MFEIDIASTKDLVAVTGVVATLMTAMYVLKTSSYSKQALAAKDAINKKLESDIAELNRQLASVGEIPQKVDVSEIERPNYYSFEYLKNKAIREYGEGCGILTIQYGSSNNAEIKSANDIDYLILIHGNYYTNESKAELDGFEPKIDSPNIPNIDIQKRLFDAFLFGLAVGKPYNVSVAVDGKVKNYHNISPNYWYFIQLVVLNMSFNRDKLLSEMDNEIAEYREDFYRELSEENKFESVIAAYNYICSLVQREEIRFFPEHFDAKKVYPLSKVKNLLQKVGLGETKKNFERLIRLFKGKESLPPLGELNQLLLNLQNSFK